MLEGLSPGDQLARVALHTRYGGSNQGGIAPSNASDAILFFTDPEVGHQHGYYDGWGEDGLFHYVGAGQRGDQKLNGHNGSVLKHHEMGRTLEGFRGARGVVTYLGEFELVDHYFTDAHETNDNAMMRQVVVFRLRPKSRMVVDLPRLPFTPEPRPVVEVVAVEEQHTEKAYVAPDREPYEAERREAKLVGLYRDHLRAQGHEVGRLRVVPPGESKPLYSDLWDERTRELVEAKGTVTRDHLRQAVGQLLDYGRFADAKTHAILVPSRPRADLLAFLGSADVCVIYPAEGGWMRIESSQS
jgi:hypothetical protein